MKCKNCVLCDNATGQSCGKITMIQRNEGARTILFLAPSFSRHGTESAFLKFKNYINKVPVPALRGYNIIGDYSIRCETNDKPSAESFKSCAPWLKSALDNLPENAIVLSSGKESNKALYYLSEDVRNLPFKETGASMKHKKNVFHYDGKKIDVFCIDSIHSIEASPEVAISNVDYLKFMSSFLEGKEIKSASENFPKKFGNPSEVKRMLEECTAEENVLVAFDIESNSLYGYHKKSKVVSYALSFKYDGELRSYCMVLNHHSINDPKATKEASDLLVWFLLNPKIDKLTHNGGYDFLFCMYQGYPMPVNWKHDTLQLASLLGFPQGQKSLKFLARKLLSVYDWADEIRDSIETTSEEDEVGHQYNSMEFSDIKVLGRYNCIDSMSTYLLLPALLDYCEHITGKGIPYSGVLKLYSELVRDTMQTLVKISYNGIKVDLVKRAEYDEFYRAEIQRLEAELHSREDVLAYEMEHLNEDYNSWANDYENWLTQEFEGKKNSRRRKPPEYVKLNFGSPKQVGKFAIEFLHLPILKRTDKGLPSIDKEVLEDYAVLAPVFNDLMRLRVVKKEHSTYISPMESYCTENSRLHTVFNQGYTSSGRLSSSNPNLQNIKSRGHAFETHKVKDLYCVPKGRFLVSIDISQAEMRVLASVANENKMIDMFNNGEDTHVATAATIFNVPKDKVTDFQRFNGKQTNFGIVYQMSSNTLGEKIYFSIYEKNAKANPSFVKPMVDEICIGEADSMLRGLPPAQFYMPREPKAPEIFYSLSASVLKAHQQSFPNIWDWIGKVKGTLRTRHYSVSPTGRVFFQPNMSSHVKKFVAEAEKTGVNAPIQGTASDLVCSGMNRVQSFLEKNNLHGKILIVNQIHDALLLDCEFSQEVVEAIKEIKKIMEDVSMYEFMKVPFVSDIEIGSSWGNLKKVKDLSTLFETAQQIGK